MNPGPSRGFFLLLALGVSLANAGVLPGPEAVRGSTPVSSPVGTRFRVEHSASGWALVSPEGERFFSRGICVVTPGASRDRYDADNPGYASWRQYPTSEAWADASLRRLRSWGFTTAAGWCDVAALRLSSEPSLWFTPVLHIGSTAGAPWWDMWDERNLRRMRSVASEQIRSLRGDRRVIGYYSDNELGWWNATLWKMTFEQPAASGQRRRLIGLLREVYQNDWSRLERDFTAEQAGSWRELQRGGTLFLRPGGGGIRVMRRFLSVLAGRYYQLMRDLIHELDPGALYLGDRYQSFYYPEVAEQCGRSADVISCNLNAAWNDGTFPRFQLQTLHELTRKPIWVSEFYLAASENRSRNRNTHGIYPVVGTQRERAVAAERTLQGLLALPYVVGADWFQYADEPRHGREDGENFNFGLVDIDDRPYEELTSMFASRRAEARSAATPRDVGRPDVSAGIPPGPSDPLADFQPTTALKSWDRERGFVPPRSEHPMADLYLCWTPAALWIGLYALDMVEEAYYRGAAVPKEDRSLWTVAANGFTARSRLGAGKEATVSDPDLRVESLSGHQLNVRNIAILEIPAVRLGKTKLQPGDQVDLEVELFTHARAYRVFWKGQYALRN